MRMEMNEKERVSPLSQMKMTPKRVSERGGAAGERFVACATGFNFAKREKV
jgi:hypothetical protein